MKAQWVNKTKAIYWINLWFLNYRRANVILWFFFNLLRYYISRVFNIIYWKNYHNHCHHSSVRAWIVRYPQTSFTEKSCFLFVSMKRPIIAKYHSKGNKTLVSRRKLTCLEQANLSNLNRYISKVPSYVPLLSKNRPLPEVQTQPTCRKVQNKQYRSTASRNLKIGHLKNLSRA